MLCRLGLGLAPIAPDVCALLRALVGADAAALFWMDGNGQPAGFHHEDSPASVRNLFLNEPHLFTGAGETNIQALAQPDGPRTADCWRPGPSTSARTATTCWYAPMATTTPWTCAWMRWAAPCGGGTVSPAGPRLQRRAGRPVGSRGRQPRARLPARCGRTGQHGCPGHRPCAAGCGRPAPRAGRRHRAAVAAERPPAGLGLYGASTADLPADLLHRLHLQPEGQRQIPVPDGVLHAQVHPLHPVAVGALQWLVTLQLQRLPQIDVVRRVQKLPLTPLQREIAVTAGLAMHATTAPPSPALATPC